MASRDLVEVYGTVYTIGPIENGLQKVSVINANTSSSGAIVDSRLVFHVQQSAYPVPISFDVNTPITGRGLYVPKTSTASAYLYRTYGVGSIRYKGIVYQ